MLKPSFLRYQPVGIRVWHWLNAATITGLLATVIVRQNFFRIRANAQLIQDKAQAAGTPISPAAAREVAETMVDHFWQWHIVLGYVLAACLVLRVVVALVHGESPLKLFRLSLKSSELHARHFSLVRGSYLLFYSVVVFMVGSGLTMIYEDDLHLSETFSHNLHAAHELCRWYFFAFVIMHIGGVIWGELGHFKGMVSNMIHGGPREE